jgi:hypothetical protein
MVNDLMSLGAGIRTSAALRELATASAGLPAPPPPAVAPGAAAPGAPPPGTSDARLTISTKPRTPMLTEPDSQEREKILDAVREYALNYTQSLPNFICTQVIRRQEDPTGSGDHYKSVDRIQEQLTYYEHQEKYKVMAVNSQMVENRDHMKMGGAMSEGEFGSMMYEIFEPSSAADFEWTKFGKLDGVIMNVFSYKIAQERSHYSIIHNDTNRVSSGYHGLIYARKDDNVIIKITLECDSIPATFPIQDVKQELWYAAAKISGREFILPQKWESHSRDGHMLAFNAAEFALYRKYEAETSIKFETDDNDDKKDENKPPDPAKPPIKKP